MEIRQQENIEMEQQEDIYLRIRLMNLVLFFLFFPFVIFYFNDGSGGVKEFILESFPATLIVLAPALAGSLSLFYKLSGLKKYLLIFAFNLVGIFGVAAFLSLFTRILHGIGESYAIFFYLFVLIVVFIAFVIIQVLPTRVLRWLSIVLILISAIYFSIKLYSTYEISKNNVTDYDMFVKLNSLENINDRVVYCDSITLASQKSHCFQDTYIDVRTSASEHTSNTREDESRPGYVPAIQVITPENLKKICDGTTYRYLDPFTHKDEDHICIN